MRAGCDVESIKRSGPKRAKWGSHPGFSLVELAVGLAVVSILMVAIGSVVVVAAKALPSAAGPGEVNLAAGAALETVAAELRYATGISESLPTSVTFTVADRDKDGNPESIRYAWSGTPGAPLTRAYNAGTAVPVIAGLNSFALSYNKLKHTATSSSTVTVDSGEVLLSAFSSWSGVVATASSTNLKTTTWAAEKFTIDRVTLPADTTRLTITRVSLKLKKPTSGTTGATVGIYLPSSAGASTPAASPVGTSCAIPGSSLTTTTAWVDATFSDVSFNNGSNVDFVLVIKGVAATTSASIQYLNAALAPLDNSVYRYSTTSGSSWLPTASLNVNDAPYSVYGSYQRQVATSVSVDTYTLKSVVLSVQPSSSATSRIDSAAETLNEPAINGP